MHLITVCSASVNKVRQLFFKLLQLLLAMLVDLDVILILELLLGVFVTMGTRLLRTEVTLCGSNTELIHRVFSFLRVPHGLHKLSHQGHGVFSARLLSYYYTLVNICLLRHTTTLSSQNTLGIFQFYCRMFTGESRDFGSSPRAFQSAAL